MQAISSTEKNQGTASSMNKISFMRLKINVQVNQTKLELKKFHEEKSERNRFHK